MLGETESCHHCEKTTNNMVNPRSASIYSIRFVCIMIMYDEGQRTNLSPMICLRCESTQSDDAARPDTFL